MPSPLSHGRRRAAFSLLFAVLLASLPSCTTAVLWGGKSKSSHRDSIATLATAVDLRDDGLHALGVLLAEPLPADFGGGIDEPTASGDWVVLELKEPDAALAEMLRLQAILPGERRPFELWLGDDDAHVLASLQLSDAQLAGVRLAPDMSVARDEKGTRLQVSVYGRLQRRDAFTGSDPTVRAIELAWYRPSPSERRVSVPAAIALTPVTVALDIVVLPAALVFGGWVLVYHSLGGRG
jgi:hypothetical protein